MRVILNPSAGYFKMQESRRYHIGLTPKGKLQFYNFTIYDNIDTVKEMLAKRFVKTKAVTAYTPQEAKAKARRRFGLP